MTKVSVTPLSGAPIAMSSTSVTVMKIAIGSLQPDSTSSTARTRSRRWMPPTRSRKNTAAASVELTTAPSRKDCSQGKPSTKRAATPTSAVVSSTPTVASTIAGSAAWRKVESLRAEAGIEEDDGERQAAEEIGGRRIVELQAEPVLAGDQADGEEDQQDRRAEAERDPAREHRRHDEPGADQDRQVHRLEHRRLASGCALPDTMG